MRLAPATAGWLRSRRRHVFLSLPSSAREETRSQPHSAALPPHSLPLSPVLTRCSEHAAQSRAPALRLASSVYVGAATAPPTGLNPHWIRPLWRYGRPRSAACLRVGPRGAAGAAASRVDRARRRWVGHGEASTASIGGDVAAIGGAAPLATACVGRFLPRFLLLVGRRGCGSSWRRRRICRPLSATRTRGCNRRAHAHWRRCSARTGRGCRWLCRSRWLPGPLPQHLMCVEKLT